MAIANPLLLRVKRISFGCFKFHVSGSKFSEGISYQHET
mgnify:CR=1 FL=1|jgi:hypothetical protein